MTRKALVVSLMATVLAACGAGDAPGPATPPGNAPPPATSPPASSPPASSPPASSPPASSPPASSPPSSPPPPGAPVVKVDAASSVVLPGQKVLLTVAADNALTAAVTWRVMEGSAGGQVAASTVYANAQNGGPQWVYTAPTTPGTYHLTATTTSQPQGSASLTLEVQPFVNGCATASGNVGVWKNITPPQVDLSSGGWFGMQAMVVDPQNPSTLYVGRSLDGIYKSTDCGGTWTKINTGRNGSTLATGSSWSLVIDPVNPQVLYTNQGYGTSGVFKSTNGGVDWDQILTPNITSVAPYGGFIGGIAMDPSDPQHLLVSWHAECAPPHTKACYAETRDGGTHWVLREGDPSWFGGEGTFIDILDSKTWFFSSSSNGMWYSTDQGANWKPVVGSQVSHGAGQVYRSKTNGIFIGAADGVMHSMDGINWSLLPRSGYLVMGLIGDGTNLYASTGFPWNPPGSDSYEPYSAGLESGGGNLSPLRSPPMRTGGTMQLDPGRHFLYSSNLNAGVWRLQTR